MKTKWTSIVLILAVVLIALPVFAEQVPSDNRAPRQGRAALTAQDDEAGAFTPQERAMIRQILRNRQQRQEFAEQRQDAAQPAQRRSGRAFDLQDRVRAQEKQPVEQARRQGRPAMTEGDDEAGRAFTSQERAMIRRLLRNRLQQREIFARRFEEAEPPAMARPQGRMLRPFAGPADDVCPRCGCPMRFQVPFRDQQCPFGAQGFYGRGWGFAPEDQPFAGRGFAERRFAGKDAERPARLRQGQDAERPGNRSYGPRPFQRGEQGQMGGFGFGAQRFEDGANFPQRRGPQGLQPDEPTLRPNRAGRRMADEPRAERRGRNFSEEQPPQEWSDNELY